MKMEETECSETSAYKIQMPGNYPGRKHTTFRTGRKFEIMKVRNVNKIVNPTNDVKNVLELNCSFSVVGPGLTKGKVKGKVHPCTGTEALYRLYGP